VAELQPDCRNSLRRSSVGYIARFATVKRRSRAVVAPVLTPHRLIARAHIAYDGARLGAACLASPVR
jgi:hypothetical protein